ncbi:hypothetical protein J4447_03720 [Candidatus Pacearchaeota archaeon]|nr:hypothetical protein [Candidatus Pacearchaeota archaeon]
MGLNKYFFDSYALIEMYKGNSNYAQYVQEDVTITIFNLAEIYYSILNGFSESVADIIHEKYKNNVSKISEKILKTAMKFRKENKKKNLSYADCIGYIYALKNNLVFLTGDKEFEGMKNVEFVK